MRLSIFAKIFISICAIILISSVAEFLLSSKLIEQHYINTLAMQLEHIAYSIEPTVKSYLTGKNYQAIDALAKELGAKTNIRITVIAPNGVVLADSQKDPRTMENHITRPEIVKALNEGKGSSLRYSSTVEERMLYMAVGIKEDKKLIGILRVSLFLHDIDTLLSKLRVRISQIVAVIAALALVAASILTKNILSAVKDLAEATKKVAEGDFTTRVNINRKDEIGKLAENFNLMSEQIKALFDKISLKQQQLDSVISSLTEKLIVLDEEGKIILYNESFKTIAPQPDRKFYWEVIRSPSIIELIEHFQESGKSIQKEIEYNDRIFLCSITPIKSRKEKVVILHDITDIKKVEQIKKDLIANVSHELRTPLTAIKGYIETLEEMTNNEAIHYLNIIKKHTNRLINIVQDLLVLSELEEKQSQLEQSITFEEIELTTLINDILTAEDKKAKEKNITLEMQVEGKIYLKADPYRLEQMVINLIDNAIKYTDKGKVTVRLMKRDRSVILEIEDTGIGIPPEHIERIFERFYVVDKARSKQSGGTGLGLSIVKHIVMLHRGEIKVNSKIGYGTTFTVILPENPLKA